MQRKKISKPKVAAKKISVKAPAKKSAKKAAKKAAVKSPAKKAPAKAAVKKSSPKKTPAKKLSVKTAAPAKKPAPKKVSRTARPKIFEQAPVVREYGFPTDAPELPANYGRDKLVLMTQDPDYLFSYWEVTPNQISVKQSEKRNGEQYREALKLNWPARSLFEENYALLPVSLDARRWYLRVPFPGLSYQVEIGWLGHRGHFISILGSNETDSPESWEATRKRLKDAGEVLAYSSRISKPSGSSENVRIDQPSVFSFEDWTPASLSSSSGSGTAGNAKKKSR